MSTKLLITGVPCTGKTTFAVWLASKFGYIPCHSDHDPKFLDVAALAASEGKNAVLDWGIPAGALTFAKRFIDEHGFQAWWFDGDIASAREIFINRPNHPASLTDWNIYIAGLKTHSGEYANLYADRYIRTLGSGSKRLMTNEEIWEKIENYRSRS
jgi:hypothetical protein